MNKKHVFIIGSRGYHYKYGGWETFVDNLVDNYDDKNAIFHISELSDDNKKNINPTENIFVDYIKTKNVGSATMLIQTIKAFNFII